MMRRAVAPQKALAFLNMGSDLLLRQYFLLRRRERFTNQGRLADAIERVILNR